MRRLPYVVSIILSLAPAAMALETIRNPWTGQLDYVGFKSTASTFQVQSGTVNGTMVIGSATVRGTVTSTSGFVGGPFFGSSITLSYGILSGTTVWNGARNTFAGNTDQVIIQENSGGLDAKKWLLKANGNQFSFLSANDSFDAFSRILQVNRSGVVITSVAIPNDVEVSSLSVDSGSTTFRKVSYKWPDTRGSPGYVLTEDGMGGLSWASPSGADPNLAGTTTTFNIRLNNLDSSTATLSLTFSNTNYIRNSDILQSGASFYVDGGTISNRLVIGWNGITAPLMIGTTFVYISTSGQVCIGTTTPRGTVYITGNGKTAVGNETLVLTGNGQLTDESASSGISFMSPRCAPKFEMRYHCNVGHYGYFLGTNDMAFHVGTDFAETPSGEIMRILTTGLVIGKTTGGQKLEVSGNSHVSGRFYANTSSASYIQCTSATFQGDTLASTSTVSYLNVTTRANISGGDFTISIASSTSNSDLLYKVCNPTGIYNVQSGTCAIISTTSANIEAWRAINDDDDSTFISTKTGSSAIVVTEHFRMCGATGTSEISKIVIYIKNSCNSPNAGNLGIQVSTDGVRFSSGPFFAYATANTTVTYATIFSSNPITGRPWTWSELNNIRIILATKPAFSSTVSNILKLYMEIYTRPGIVTVQNGLVGIGNIEPQALLDVRGSTSATAPYTVYWSTNDKNDGTFSLAIPSATGNIGIRTTTPSYPLEVNGDMRVNGRLFFLDGSSMNAGAMPYASYSSTEIQSIPTGIVSTISFNVNEVEWNISHSTFIQNSTITIREPGTYLITFSAMLKVSVANKSSEIWARINGVDVPRSNTKFTISSANDQKVMTVTYIFKFNKGDYFQLAMTSDDNGNTLNAIAPQTGPVRPACPSVILTVNKIDMGR